MFYQPTYISQLLLIPNVKPNIVASSKNETSPNKIKVMQKEQITSNNLSLKNEEYKVVVNYDNNSSEANANNIPSLRATLREGMSRHDKTGRISKMFFDDVCSIAQSI